MNQAPGKPRAPESFSPKERLLLSPQTTVTCPSCEHEFSLREGFARKALESLEQASATALAAVRDDERQEVERRAQEIAGQQDRTAKLELAGVKKLMEEQASAHARALADVQGIASQAFAPQIEALQTALADRDGQLKSLAEREAAMSAREQTLEARVAEAAKHRAAELIAAEKQGFESQLQTALTQVSTLRAQEIELRREKGALADKAASMEVESARKLDAEREAIAAKARQQEQERAGFEKAELQKKLDDVNSKLADAQRKIEQGSQQAQGEVLELALEAALRQTFPVDTFEEVRKGTRGADVIQRVTTRSLQIAGTILWEAKRAKDWGRDWPAKLKEDMRAAGADIGILVSTTLPKELPPGQQFGLYEDIWVSTWGAAIALAEALREGVQAVHRQRLISAGKGEKMEALYDYLTSAQFALKLKAIYAAFQGMQEDLQKERNAAEQRFARREKQIQTGMKELLGFAGDVQGLAQQDLPMLEMEPREGASVDRATDAESSGPAGSPRRD